MSRLIDVVRTALRSLQQNLLRSVLTILGIVIGIAAVIAMMEIGSGSAQAIQKTIAAMGANTLVVLPGMASSAGVSFGSGSELTLTADDGEALGSLPSVRAAAPVIRSKGQVVYGNSNWVPNSVQGTTPAFFAARDWETSEGEVFSDRDVRSATKVCLVGQTVARELSPGEPLLGQEIRVSNVALRVIGVLAPKGANMMGADQDDIVIMPWTTLKFRVSGVSGTTTSAGTTVSGSGEFFPSSGAVLYPSGAADTIGGLSTRRMNVDQIVVAAASAEAVQNAIGEVTEVLRERHRLRPGAVDDFSIRNVTEMTKAMSATSQLMTRLLLAVALISLLVGGVGIMNIMLVTVTERTREIGLRMAVGAQARHILAQFLAEAIILCFVGGVAGLVLGKGTAWAVRGFLSWPIASSSGVVIAAVGVSALVGIVFGFYPAWKGAQMDPIEALRHD